MVGVVVPRRRGERSWTRLYINCMERARAVGGRLGRRGRSLALWAVVRAIHRMGQNRGVDGEDVSRVLMAVVMGLGWVV